MRLPALIAAVLAVSATSAMAEGADCAGKYSASLQQRQSTASAAQSTPRTGTTVVVAETTPSGTAGTN